MSTKVPPTVDTQEEQEQRAPEAGTEAGEVLLRDESDEIIDHLKSQLNALQDQLGRYKKDQAEAQEHSDWQARWQAGLTPHIAERLQMPADELTERLTRLLGQVDEPAVREELEKSRDTATFFSETFRRISENHDTLTETLTDEARPQDAEAFRGALEDSLRQRGLPAEVARVGAFPARVVLSPHSVITVLTTLVDLAANLLSEAVKLELACEPDGAGGLALRVRVTSSGVWRDVRPGDEVSTVVIRSGLRSHAVVDLLYVEKIIEMRGGRLGFFRQDGAVHGFEVGIPVSADPTGSG